MILPLLLALSPALATDVDASQTEASGSARMVGMAGAYRAISEGAAAQRLNPAAIAVRRRGTDPTRTRFDGVATARGLLPVIQSIDLGSLRDAPLPTLGLTGGVVVARGAHAGAVLVDLRSRYDEASEHGTTVVEISGGWGATLSEDRLQIGLIPALTIVRSSGPDRGHTAALPTLGAGVRWDIDHSPVRLGAALRTPARSHIEDPAVDGIRLPWEAGLGVALRRGLAQHGARPEGFEASRAPIFVQWAFDLALTGPLADVTSVEAWTRDEVAAADSPLSLAVHTGLELEPAPHWLRVRLGVYTEPARARLSLDGVVLHGTLGMDIALFELPRGRHRWAILPVIDVSSLGVRPALGIGTW